MVESLSFTSCSQVVTAFATVLIQAQNFTAKPVTLTFLAAQSPTFYITYQYPSVTLSSLSPGEILTFVCFPRENYVTVDWKNLGNRYRC